MQPETTPTPLNFLLSDMTTENGQHAIMKLAFGVYGEGSRT